MRRPHLVAAVLGMALLALPAGAASAHDTPALVFPQDARVTSFVSSFGAERAEGRSHEGNDLLAPRATPVYAVLDGTVTRMADGERAGQHVVIAHDGGWESWYMHLDDEHPGTGAFASGLTVGSVVVAGQLIGFVGDSGNASGTPHTHFELHQGNTPIDPYLLLRDAFERAVASLEAERIALLQDRMA